MVFIKQSLLALFGAISLVSSVAIPAVQDVTPIVADLGTIGDAITYFNTEVSGFGGDFGGALAVLDAVTKLDNAVKSVTADVVAAPAFSVDDSSAVTSAGVALGNQVLASLNILTGKEPVFSAGGFNSIVVSNLNTLATDNNALSAALQAKVQPADLATIQATAANLTAAYQATVAAFSAPSS